MSHLSILTVSLSQRQRIQKAKTVCTIQRSNIDLVCDCPLMFRLDKCTVSLVSFLTTPTHYYLTHTKTEHKLKPKTVSALNNSNSAQWKCKIQVTHVYNEMWLKKHSRFLLRLNYLRGSS